jgi:hypothetical protein
MARRLLLFLKTTVDHVIPLGSQGLAVCHVYLFGPSGTPERSFFDYGLDSGSLEGGKENSFLKRGPRGVSFPGGVFAGKMPDFSSG